LLTLAIQTQRHRPFWAGQIYPFAGSGVGGERAAAMYTIVQTAKLNGVNPEAYMHDALTKIAHGHPDQPHRRTATVEDRQQRRDLTAGAKRLR
jgi:hypothetical protein